MLKEYSSKVLNESGWNLPLSTGLKPEDSSLVDDEALLSRRSFFVMRLFVGVLFADLETRPVRTPSAYRQSQCFNLRERARASPTIDVS